MRRLLPILLLTFAVLLGTVGDGWSAGYRGACDELAENPSDKNKLTEGVRWDELVPDKAIRACRKAIKEYPDDPKIQYQLGRALDKGKKYEEAVKWYTLAAEQGNTNAQNNLGVMYRRGDGVPQNSKTAVKWYRLAAEQGDAYAQNNLGTMYYNGEGVPQDYKTAAKWYRLAAEQGHARAQFFLGILYHYGWGPPQDYKSALRWYRLAAEQGIAFAQTALGQMYLSGEGGPQDSKTAVKWFTLAAEQGNSNAQYNLGTMYRRGKHVPKNYRTAAKWYKLAAEQGDANAQVNLGWLYENGQGVPRNYKIAAKWLKLAADQGDAVAQNDLDRLQAKIAEQKPSSEVSAEKSSTSSSGDYQKGYAAYKKGDYATALREFKPLAEQGFINAQNFLALMYENGQGVPRNIETALKWYRLAAEQKPSSTITAEKTPASSSEDYEKAQSAHRKGDYATAARILKKFAKQGHTGAQYNLGVMYQNGQGVSRDNKTAVKWFTLAAEQGNAMAQNSLGVMYEKGHGVPSDIKTAVKWYTLAAEQGDAKSQFNLGLKNNIGQGVPQNYKTAANWYKLAAEQGVADAQYNLGLLYFNGQGVLQNYIRAHIWWNIAASSGHKNAAKNRDTIAKNLSPSQLVQAQEIARKFVPRKHSPAVTTGKPPSRTPRKGINPNKIISASSGSGFAVSADGHVITNNHVINGCNKVKIHHDGQSISARVITYDPQNDLALLKGDFRPTTVFSLSNQKPELLQDIYVAGYPFGRKISTSVKVTKGIVSSLTGIGNNFSNIQIDAALQPGNSGGPILSDRGNVVGVAVAKLDLKKVLKNFGVIPEDTNFGIKTSVVRSLLESSNISLRSPNTKTISKSKLGKMISDGTYYLSCWMTTAQIKKMRSKKVIFQNLD